MPIEILELIVRARIQQSGTEIQAQPGGQNAATGAPANGQTNSQLQPTVEDILDDVLKRRQER
jgi:hypothetical protein